MTTRFQICLEFDTVTIAVLKAFLIYGPCWLRCQGAACCILYS